MNISVHCFTGANGLKTLETTWLDLFNHCINPSFYNDWRWHWAIQKHLIHHDIHYFCVYEEELPVAIIPLTTEVKHKKGIPVAQLGFPQHRSLDCADMLIRKEKTDWRILQAVLDYIEAQQLMHWSLLELTRFTGYSATSALSGESKRPMGHSAYVKRNGQDCFLRSLSKKQAKNARRNIKKSEQDHYPVKFLYVSQPEDVKEAYQTFLKIEASSWKSEKGTALYLQDNEQRFFEEVLQAFAKTQQARVNVLRIGNRPAAAQLGLLTSNKLSLLKIGYDEGLKKVGPGGIALLKCMETQTPSLEEIDLVTNPSWSARWHFSHETLWQLMYFNTTFRARCLSALWHGRAKLKQLGKR